MLARVLVASVFVFAAGWVVPARAAAPPGVRIGALPDFDEEDEDVPWDEEEDDAPPVKRAPAKQAAPVKQAGPAATGPAAVDPAALRSDREADTEAARPAGGRTHEVVLPERELNGHYFLPPLGLATPFVTSHVGAVTTFAVADLKFTDETIRQNMRELEELLDADFDELPLFLLSQAIEFEVSFLERASLRAGVQGSALMPRDQDTAWLMAVDGAWGVGGGIAVQALKLDAVALAASLDYGRETTVFVSPVGTIAELLTTGQLNEETMFTLGSVDTLSVGAQAAASPHPVVGFLAEAAMDFERSTSDDESTADPDDEMEVRDQFFRLGVGASVDFSWFDVPVGVTGSYIRRFPVDGDNDTELDSVVGGGLFYTGRRYLLLGVEAQFLTLESETDEIGAVGAALRIRAYF